MKTFTSFTDLGTSAFGITPRQPKKERPRKCKFCGQDMQHIVGTNVWTCNNMVTRTRKNKETGETYEVEEICGNTICSKAG